MFIGSNVQIESIDVKASVTTHVASLAVFEHELQDLSHLASLALSVSVGEIVDLGSVGKVVADVVACVRVLHAAVADRIRGALGTVATEVECCAYSVLAIACVTLVDRDRLGDVPVMQRACAWHVWNRTGTAARPLMTATARSCAT